MFSCVSSLSSSFIFHLRLLSPIPKIRGLCGQWQLAGFQGVSGGGAGPHRCVATIVTIVRIIVTIVVMIVGTSVVMIVVIIVEIAVDT